MDGEEKSEIEESSEEEKWRDGQRKDKKEVKGKHNGCLGAPLLTCG